MPLNFAGSYILSCMSVILHVDYIIYLGIIVHKSYFQQFKTVAEPMQLSNNYNNGIVV